MPKRALPKGALRVIAYVRVSDTTGREGKDNFVSPDVQVTEIKRHCQRKGHVIVDTVTDLNKSGKSSDKRAIRKIIQRIENGEADVVVVWKISRWGRNVIDSMLNINALQAAGGTLESATEGLDEYDSPQGGFNLHILLAVAELYSKEIGKTWKNIHDYRRGNGKTHNASPRLGYLRVKELPEEPEERAKFNVRKESDYVIDPDSGPWVAKAFQWYVDGVSMYEIVGRLNDAGVRTTRNGPVTKGSLMASMDGGFAAGLIVDRRTKGKVEYHPGSHDALISPELWAKYLRRRREHVPVRIKSAPYRLAGLVRCGSCGGSMNITYTKNKKTAYTYRYLRCGSRAVPRGSALSTCERPAMIGEPAAEKLLLAWLKSHAEGQAALDAAVARAYHAEEMKVNIAKIDREIASKEKNIHNLAIKNASGVMDDEVFKVVVAIEKEQLAALREAKEKAQVSVEINELPSMDTFGALVRGWKGVSPAEYNRALRSVLRRIAVIPAGQRGGRATIEVIPSWGADSGLGLRPAA